MRQFYALMLSALLTACASPSQRIERKLVEYGVPAPQAQCMGDRLARRLSNAELRQLDRLVSVNAERLGRMRLEELGRALSGTDNPALVADIVRTGIGCLL